MLADQEIRGLSERRRPERFEALEGFEEFEGFEEDERNSEDGFNRRRRRGAQRQKSRSEGAAAR
jgi:hypothetical protein